MFLMRKLDPPPLSFGKSAFYFAPLINHNMPSYKLKMLKDNLEVQLSTRLAVGIELL